MQFCFLHLLLNSLLVFLIYILSIFYLAISCKTTDVLASAHLPVISLKNPDDKQMCITIKLFFH